MVLATDKKPKSCSITANHKLEKAQKEPVIWAAGRYEKRNTGNPRRL